MAATSELPKSCAQIAARLVVEGCLPIIQDNVKTTAPDGAVVPLEDRARLGLTEPGLTFFFAAGEEGVFYDLGRSEFKVWFTGDDYQNATSTLHNALLQAFPKAKQLDDVVSASDARLHARVYRVEFGNGRIAAVSTSFSALPSGKQKFLTRVIAQERT